MDELIGLIRENPERVAEILVKELCNGEAICNESARDCEQCWTGRLQNEAEK